MLSGGPSSPMRMPGSPDLRSLPVLLNTLNQRASMAGSGLEDNFSGAVRIEVPLGSGQFGAGGETIRFEPPDNRFVQNVSFPTLTLHVDASTARPRPVMLILPGGGYTGVSLDKEGHCVANWLTTMGFAAAVVKYRCPPHKDAATGLPNPFADVLDALAWVADHADFLSLDTSEVGLMGFSAGGHLAGSVGLRFDELASGRTLPRPRFLALIYPVVSSADLLGHSGSFQALEGYGAGLITPHDFHLENHLDKTTPPMFLAHALDDPTVPVAGTQNLAECASRKGCHVTFHACRDGGHGFGLGTPGNDSASWLDPFARWLTARPWRNTKA